VTRVTENNKGNGKSVIIIERRVIAIKRKKK
jgi:hypothetical protein